MRKITATMCLIYLTLLVACIAPQPRVTLTCKQIVDPKLASAPRQNLTQDIVREWVKDNYKLDDKAIRSPIYRDGTSSVQWKVEGRSYYIWIRNYPQVEMEWKSQQPTLDEMLSCLGTPKLYQAEQEVAADGSYYSLALWYPDQGMMVSATNSKPEFTGRTVMIQMILVSPGPMEEMLLAAYPPGSSPVYQNPKSLKPWPGKVEQIVTGTDPNLK